MKQYRYHIISLLDDIHKKLELMNRQDTALLTKIDEMVNDELDRYIADGWSIKSFYPDAREHYRYHVMFEREVVTDCSVL